MFLLLCIKNSHPHMVKSTHFGLVKGAELTFLWLIFLDSTRLVHISYIYSSNGDLIALRVAPVRAKALIGHPHKSMRKAALFS